MSVVDHVLLLIFKLKCHRYWTDTVQSPFCIYPNYYVELKSEPIIYDECIERHLIISYPKIALDGSQSTERLEFVQYHFTDWPGKLIAP